jgi:prepilin-type N-terminal cleavage/methylation domain-containing protein
MENPIKKIIRSMRSLFINQRGFSLIEVAIAMGVFSIGALTVSQLLILSLQNNKTGNQITQATMLAEAKMEELKSTVDVTTLANSVESSIDQYGRPGGIYTRTTTITNPLGGNYSRQVVVTVRWIGKGRLRRVLLSSFTHGNGI